MEVGECDPLTAFSCIVSTIQQSVSGTTNIADLPPPITDNNLGYTQQYVNDILQRFWLPNDGFSHQELHQLTYGEVTALGARQLAYEMKISSNIKTKIHQKCSPGNDSNYDNITNEDDEIDTRSVVFYDLGSGVGRLATQMYLDHPDRVKRSVGVELSLERHEIAAKAFREITHEFTINDKKILSSSYPNDDDADSDNYECFVEFMVSNIPSTIEFIHGNALEIDFTDATHVFMSSLCFPKEVLLKLQEKVLILPKIEVVAALNRLNLLWLRKGEWKEREIPIQMTWGPSTAKIYTKTHPL
jgi:hypothetical protein